MLEEGIQLRKISNRALPLGGQKKIGNKPSLAVDVGGSNTRGRKFDNYKERSKELEDLKNGS